jgi:hypothetical protein
VRDYYKALIVAGYEEKWGECTKKDRGCGKKHESSAVCLAPEVKRCDVREAREATKERKKVDRDVSIQFEARYFRFRDLVCEERVAGLFDGGSDLPLRSPPRFLLFPEDAK